MRKQLRALTKQWKTARSNGDVLEMAGLDEVREMLRKRLKSLRKAERSKRKGKEQEKKES